MKLLGYELTFRKALPVVAEGTTYAPIPYPNASFFGIIREAFTGAWQRNIEVRNPRTILAFSGVYAAVQLISNDISKLGIELTHETTFGTWEEVEINSPYLPVLAKPNHYQTRQQFLSQWMVSKLLFGNTYILKERDSRNIVRAMYPLDPRLVEPVVAIDGTIGYRLQRDALSGLVDNAIVVPASEIIHDRMLTLWHPLIGVSPIFACATSVMQGMSIQDNSATFFRNMSRPSGQLTAPGKISDQLAARMKKEFEENFKGGNLGRLMVTGEGLKYEPMVIPAADAQLIEQLRWTVEDVARAFCIPAYKIESSVSGRAPAANIGALNQDYYDQTLQIHVEAIEALLAEGLALPPRYDIELDTDDLLRMDPLSRSEQWKNAISGGWMAPNEVRAKEGLRRVTGGDSPMIQQQNYSLEALYKRDAQPNPFAKPETPKPAPEQEPEQPGETEPEKPGETEPESRSIDAFELFMAATREFSARIAKGLPHE